MMLPCVEYHLVAAIVIRHVEFDIRTYPMFHAGSAECMAACAACPAITEDIVVTAYRAFERHG
jgi:hypothetical protein